MRAIALLAAAAMVASLFLPWLSAGAFGRSFSPWDIIKQLDPSRETLEQLLNHSPKELLAFLASFALAALFVILGLIGFASRLLALLTGGLVLVMMAVGAWQIREGTLQLPLPLPSNLDAGKMFELAQNILGLGAWAWAGGAILLFLAGLIGFARR